MKFTDRLRELEANATDAPWRVLDDFEERAAGIQFKSDGGAFLHHEMPHRSENVELIAYLRNHAKEIINLVEAAEQVSSDFPVIGSDLSVALAALGKEQS